jgi:hypothetical protein
VRRAYRGYTGPRPRAQLWHGTNDTLVPYSLLQETIEQWTDVFRLGQTPTSSDTPQPNWNRRRYTDGAGTVQVEAYSIQGAGHSLPGAGMAAAAIAFFGLTGTTTPPSSSPPSSGPPSSSPPSSGSCRVTATVNAWNTGLTASLTITNTGATAVNGWSLAFTLPGGQSITSGWHAGYAPASGRVTAQNVSYNGAIAPNGTVSIGFQATHTGDTGRPSDFTLNGSACGTA